MGDCAYFQISGLKSDLSDNPFYVSDESYSLENDDIFGSIFTHFTEVRYPPNSKPVEEDYLGLQVWFFIYKCGNIEICSIDSSSI